MYWIVAVVNMMVAGGDNEIFQPRRFPGYVHMHPVVAGYVLNCDELKDACANIYKIGDDAKRRTVAQNISLLGLQLICRFDRASERGIQHC